MVESNFEQLVGNIFSINKEYRSRPYLILDADNRFIMTLIEGITINSPKLDEIADEYVRDSRQKLGKILDEISSDELESITRNNLLEIGDIFGRIFMIAYFGKNNTPKRKIANKLAEMIYDLSNFDGLYWSHDLIHIYNTRDFRLTKFQRVNGDEEKIFKLNYGYMDLLFDLVEYDGDRELPLSLKEMVESIELCTSAEYELRKKRFDFEIDLDSIPDFMLKKGEYGLVQTVIFNLINNAVKAGAYSREHNKRLSVDYGERNGLRGIVLKQNYAKKEYRDMLEGRLSEGGFGRKIIERSKERLDARLEVEMLEDGFVGTGFYF